MSLKAGLPGYRDPIVGQGGLASRPVYTFFQTIATTVDSLSDQIGNVTTTPAESPVSENANVVGKYSIYTRGILKTGIVSVLLIGDVETPGKTQYYGSDATGEKGWYAVSDALDSTANITLTVGTDGVTTFDLSSGVLASLSLADTSVQPGDAISTLTNDAGYLTDAPIDGSLYGRKNGAWTVFSGAGSGDVVGPASAADGDAVLFDGTTGKLLKDGGSFGSLVRAAVLTGLSTTTSAIITATDTVLGALGKLQAQITDNLLPKGYIDGLRPTFVSATAVTIKSGACYIPGSGKVVRNDSDIALTGLAPGASTWAYLYVYESSGVLAGELSTTAPAAPYNGTARCKTGDTSRRYVGCVKTDGSGAIYNFEVSSGSLLWRFNTASVSRLLSGGLATAVTTVSASAFVPPTSTVALLSFFNGDTGATNFALYGWDGSAFVQFYAVFSGGTAVRPFNLSTSQQMQYRFSSAPVNGGYIDVLGFVMDR